jgi:hypothetical protein
VWVYTLVNTDYDGNKLLPHFLNYYHAHGITWRRFLVVLHHTPGKYSRKGLEDAMGICSGYAVECRCGARAAGMPCRPGAKCGCAGAHFFYCRGVAWNGPLFPEVSSTAPLPGRLPPAEALYTAALFNICRVWEGNYSSEDHLSHQLGMLADYISDPTDWVVTADVDEFQWWGGKFIK